MKSWYMTYGNVSFLEHSLQSVHLNNVASLYKEGPKITHGRKLIQVGLNCVACLYKQEKN
jgi:hypothetical protein